MNDTDNYESRLWKLLGKQKLADLSQFHRPGFFDEAPLYSRESDLDFLPRDENRANEVLLRFALKFLNSVIAYEQHHAGYFAAVTVWNFSDSILVPNLFVWCDALGELEEKLLLKAATTPFGKQLKKLVLRLGLGASFEVFEDTSTAAHAARVFIAPAQPPYSGFATLDHFRRPARAAK